MSLISLNAEPGKIYYTHRWLLACLEKDYTQPNISVIHISDKTNQTKSSTALTIRVLVTANTNTYVWLTKKCTN